MIISVNNLFDSKDGIDVFLSNIEKSQGLKEAKAAARAFITRHIRRPTNRHTYDDYQMFVAAVEWLANAEGLKVIEEDMLC